MLTCIALSKQGSVDQSPSIDQHQQQRHESATKCNHNDATSKHAIKTLSSQVKDMALKASGAYRHCTPCSNQPANSGSAASAGDSNSPAASEKFRWSYRRTRSSNGRRELEARLKGISSGEGTPGSASGRRVEPIIFIEESKPKEWVAHVEPGVLITFMSLPCGGNDLKRIRFNREMFNKHQAQTWWAENAEKVKELYNIRKLNHHLQAFPLPTAKTESIRDSPVTSPPCKEPIPPRTLSRAGMTIGCSSSDSLDHQSSNSCDVSSTPKPSSISAGAKTETSSVSSSSSTISNNASEMESEWVEEDEPGVYITIRVLADGRRELRRVRFSREKYGKLDARLWWEENRARIHKRYL